ncbi:MAG: YceI family protein [Streptosporangiales bacterium]
MGTTSGTYAVGPEQGTLELRTYREGAASKAGHDLVLDATRWSGTVTVDADNAENSSVELSVEVAGLTVREGHGGVKPLSDKDRAEIVKTINSKVLDSGQHPSITFRSTSVTAAGDRGTVTGDLTIAGTTESLEVPFRVQDEEGASRVTGETSVVQTRWGVKPYRGFLGALRLRDAVDVRYDISLK